MALFGDFHLDYSYIPGMNTKCGDPICCRQESGLPDDPKDAAGPWGDYLCDVPERTALNMLDFIREQI